MSDLANTSISSLYTITTAEWTAINTRVGDALAVENIQSIIVQDYPSYPTLLQSSKLWMNSTFIDLISASQDLVPYCDKALTNFGAIQAELQALIDAAAPKVPESLQQATISALDILVADTAPLAAADHALFTLISAFLLDNQHVDQEMAANQSAMGSFWEPLGDIISAVESAIGKVKGTWNAIDNDLNATLATATDMNITIPFMESLGISVAMESWNRIKQEATAFPSMVDGQEAYWVTN